MSGLFPAVFDSVAVEEPVDADTVWIRIHIYPLTLLYAIECSELGTRHFVRVTRKIMFGGAFSVKLFNLPLCSP